MRALTVRQVREALSGATATGFFEGWTAADAERARLEARLEELASQAIGIECRVRLAETLAHEETRRAEAERVRAIDATGAQRDLVRLEAEALAQSHLQRAQELLDEAHQRRERSVLLGREAEEEEGVLRQVRERQQLLRESLEELGGYAGEACLFFADAENPGGFLFVPLAALRLGARLLEPFVLHRLAAGQPLSAALPVRDLPDSPDDSTARDDGADPLEPPRERTKTTPPEGT